MHDQNAENMRNQFSSPQSQTFHQAILCLIFKQFCDSFTLFCLSLNQAILCLKTKQFCVFQSSNFVFFNRAALPFNQAISFLNQATLCPSIKKILRLSINQSWVLQSSSRASKPESRGQRRGHEPDDTNGTKDSVHFASDQFRIQKPRPQDPSTMGKGTYQPISIKLSTDLAGVAPFCIRLTDWSISVMARPPCSNAIVQASMGWTFCSPLPPCFSSLFLSRASINWIEDP